MNIYLDSWLKIFRAAQIYFRYEVEGFEYLRTGSALLVGYHGGPWALDIFMLSTRIFDELDCFPRAIFLDTWSRFPVLRDMVAGLDGLYGAPTSSDVENIRASGQHIIVLPGGTREALRPFWRRGRIDFGARRGYLQLAIEHQLPIIPVVASGIDRTFLGLTDGYAASKRLFGKGNIPLWLGVGLTGLWPLAVPFPVKIKQVIGAPMSIDPRASLEVSHRRVSGVLQEMLDRLRTA